MTPARDEATGGSDPDRPVHTFTRALARTRANRGKTVAAAAPSQDLQPSHGRDTRTEADRGRTQCTAARADARAAPRRPHDRYCGVLRPASAIRDLAGAWSADRAPLERRLMVAGRLARVRAD